MFDVITCYKEQPMGPLLKRLFISSLRNMAKKTETKIDDTIVDIVESAINSEAFMSGLKDFLDGLTAEERLEVQQILAMAESENIG